MKKVSVIVAIVMGVLVWVNICPAIAGSISKRQDNQRNRIREGIANCSLTPVEAHLLAYEQRRIRRNKADAWSDGILRRGEWRHLNHMQNMASDHIYRLKHN